MSSVRAASGRPQRPTGAPTKRAATTSTATKTTLRQPVTAKKEATTARSTTSTKSVRLDEIDPNSGPLDVPQKVILYGQGIDTSRMKVKFGSQPAVFLQSVATAAGHKITCVVPPVPRSKSGGRVAVHLVSILDERKILNPNDHVHYRYSPKTLLDSDTLLSVSHVFSVIDTMTQQEKEFFAAAFHRQSTAGQTPPAPESRKQCLTLMKKVSTELSILGRSTQSQSLASLRASSSLSDSQDLFADIDKKLERDRKSKQVSDALADFLPEVAADFRRVQSGDTSKPSARQEQASLEVVEVVEALTVPAEDMAEESDDSFSKRVNFRTTLEFVPAVGDHVPTSPVLEGPPTMIPAAADEPDRELKDRLDSFSEVSADEVDLKYKRAAQSEHLPGLDPPLSSSFDVEDDLPATQQEESIVGAFEVEPPKEADLIHPEMDDAVETVSDDETPAPLDEVALKEEQEEERIENDDEATSAELTAPASIPTEEVRDKSESEEDANQLVEQQNLSEEQDEMDDDSAPPPPPENEDDDGDEPLVDEDAPKEAVDAVQSEHHLQSAPLDEEALRERSEEEVSKSVSREAVFEEDFDATPQREQPLGEILNESDAPSEEPVHHVQFSDDADDEDDAPITTVPLDEVALKEKEEEEEGQSAPADEPAQEESESQAEEEAAPVEEEFVPEDSEAEEPEDAPVQEEEESAPNEELQDEDQIENNSDEEERPHRLASAPLDEVALREESSASEHHPRSAQFEEEETGPTVDEVIIEQYIANNQESSVEVHFDDDERPEDDEQDALDDAPVDTPSEEDEQAEAEPEADQEDDIQAEDSVDAEPVIDEEQENPEDDEAQESEHAEEEEPNEETPLSEHDKAHQLDETPLDEVALHDEVQEHSHSGEAPVFEENFDEPIREPVLGDILAGDKSDDEQEQDTTHVHFSEDVSDPAEEYSDSTDSKPRKLLGLSHLDVSDSENDPEFPASLDGNRGSDWDSASLHPEDPFREDDTIEIPTGNEDQPLDETVLDNAVDVEPPVSQVNVSLDSDHSTWTVDLNREEELDVPLVNDAPLSEEGTTQEINDSFGEDLPTQSPAKSKNLDFDDVFAGSAPARTTTTKKPVDFDDIFG